MRFDDIVRSERYFTATLLPAILFHDGLGGLDAFLALLDDAARDGEMTQHDRLDKVVPRPRGKPTWSKKSVEVITEFHIARDLRFARLLHTEAAPSVEAEKRSAPDVVIVLDDELVVCEAKFFDAPSMSKLNAQLRLQRRQIRYLLSLRPDLRIYRHVAILPVKFDVQPECDVVLTWEQVADLATTVLGSTHYVTARLRAAIKFYQKNFGDRGVRNFDGVLPLAEMLEKCRTVGNAISVGHVNGESDLLIRPLAYLEAKPWKWRNPVTNAGARIQRNWIPGGRFVALIEQRRREAEPIDYPAPEDPTGFIEVPSAEWAKKYGVTEAADMYIDEETDQKLREDAKLIGPTPYSEEDYADIEDTDEEYADDYEIDNHKLTGVQGLKLTDGESGAELCRIWLRDGIIHTAGQTEWIETLLNLRVGIGTIERTHEDPDWLDAMYQSWRSTPLSLAPFNPDEEVQEDTALGELDDHT
jgi:hypothetical protein